jgi:alpha-galactosidase
MVRLDDVQRRERRGSNIPAVSARSALIVVSITALALAASDLTGRWVSRTPNGDGTFRETIVVLNADGAALTGSVITPTAEQPIVDGAVDGAAFHFATVTGPATNQRRTEYRGVLASRDEVRITIVRSDRPAQELIASRGADSAGRMPPRIDPPALHASPDNGLARTPPMGWNSWNHFKGAVDDATVRAIADAMVSSGMQRAGYVYVNIDDTWEAGRDAAGRILTNRKFPDMKALADYVHGKGLKLGIYSSPGPLTCAGYEGSYGHEEDDARTYAAWGIDYLKYDWCSAGRIYKDDEMQAVYQKMGDALRATGRPIVYSLCQYGRNNVWTWAPAVGGNLWRTTGDISDTWASMTRIGFGQDPLAQYASAGHWNDPDMLEVGNGGMTDAEYRTHMSLWALLAAPLLAGNDLRNMSSATLQILTDASVIAIDQDPAGRQGRRVKEEGDREVWVRPLANGAYAVGFFNRGGTSAQISAKCEELEVCGDYQVRDVWSRQDLGAIGSTLSTTVESHGVKLLKLTPSTGNGVGSRFDSRRIKTTPDPVSARAAASPRRTRASRFPTPD